MKIAMDSRSATIHSGTGIGTYTQNLVDVLIKKDNLDIKFFWTGDYSNFSSNELNKLCFVSSRNNNFFEKTFIPHYICNNKIDLYHIPQNGIGLYDNPYINTIVTIHDLIPYIMPETVGSGYLQKFLRDMPTIINSSKGILTVSNHSKNDILKFFPSCPSNKIIVTPLFANSSFKPLPKNYCSLILKQQYNIDFPFILYLGGFSTRKNVKMLINSFKSILNDIPSNYKLVLIGSIKDEGNKLIDYDNNCLVTYEKIQAEETEGFVKLADYNGNVLIDYAGNYLVTYETNSEYLVDYNDNYLVDYNGNKLKNY